MIPTIFINVYFFVFIASFSYSLFSMTKLNILLLVFNISESVLSKSIPILFSLEPIIISKGFNYNNKHKVFFSKSELQIILQTYSKQVSSGVCRDYSTIKCR